ncbi:MAG TPA: hypothetical protein DCZ94_00375 [Lentisphaeria bacterium]|nr:MAG: hypothetical protein A2X48_18870 [Lentisphaerae bacterium GWF2_49_21]HBC85386.1 hypothetical protein [Lentisphaeria bacterium]
MKKLAAIIISLAFMVSLFAEEDIGKLNTEAARYRAGVERVQTYLKTQCSELFAGKDVMPRREQKEMLWNSWKSLLDYYFGLDTIQNSCPDFTSITPTAEQKASFICYYSSFLAEYRLALDFIGLVEKNPMLHKILNDKVPELDIPEGTYSEFKLRFLNPGIASKFAALDSLRMLYKLDKDASADMETDRKGILDAGRGKGLELTFANALKIIRDESFTAIFPAQYKISEWMGDTKVYRKGKTLISGEQMKELVSVLQPGDILLERREWYLSNVGLPGFWPHAALYIGTPEERAKYFAGDKAVSEWTVKQGEASGDFEKLIMEKNPDAYKISLTPESNHPRRILEAMSEGVLFTSIEHSTSCDFVAVLRPRLPKIEKARAILDAFHFSGRPYDFDFDFLSDATIVCTELVYKSYEPREGFKGLKFPLVDIGGRKVTPANEMAKQYAEQAGTDQQQTDLVVFYDGSEKDKKAVKSTEDEFKKSWTRPKWHMLTAKTPASL